MTDDPFARAVERAEATEKAEAAEQRERRSARMTRGHPWFVWVLLGWGIGLSAHYAAVKEHLS